MVFILPDRIYRTIRRSGMSRETEVRFGEISILLVGIPAKQSIRSISRQKDYF